IGMQRVDDPSSLLKVAQATQSMAARAFGDSTIYLERLVPKARHVEVQVFGLGEGNVVHFFERECSVQRRYQKIIEETPAPNLPARVRDEMARAAVALARQERYRGVGTVEFVVDADSLEHFFLEMNTRIQVEHPVTEMTTAIDLVALQIRLASGEAPVFAQDDIRQVGHAIEVRVYAENPDRNFLPSPGRISRLVLPPESSRLRIDRGVREGDQITVFYDPMIVKLIARGDSRMEAIDTMIEALRQTRIEGILTNIPFLIRVLDHASFRGGDT